MKIAPKDVDSLLKAPQARFRAALIYGPDTGLVRQRSDVIASAILPDLADPFNKIELTYEQLQDDPARLHDEAAAMSFTGDTRLIMVRDAGDKLSKSLEEILDGLTEQTFLLLYTGELTPRSSLRQLAEKHSACASIACYKDEGYGLENLIRDTLRGYGIEAQDGVAQYLSQQLGGDRMIILSELEKLSLYLGDDTVLGLATVQHVVGESNEKTLDDLCNAIAEGNSAAAMHICDRLFAEGAQAVMIIRMLQRHFTRMQQVQMRVDEGEPLPQAVKSLRPPVFFKQVPAFTRQVQRWRSQKLASAMQLLQKAEIQAKTTGLDSNLMCAHAICTLARVA